MSKYLLIIISSISAIYTFATKSKTPSSMNETIDLLKSANFIEAKDQMTLAESWTEGGPKLLEKNGSWTEGKLYNEDKDDGSWTEGSPNNSTTHEPVSLS